MADDTETALSCGWCYEGFVTGNEFVSSWMRSAHTTTSYGLPEIPWPARWPYIPGQVPCRVLNGSAPEMETTLQSYEKGITDKVCFVFALFCLSLSCHVLPCIAQSCHVLSVLAFLALSCRIMSCHVLPRRVSYFLSRLAMYCIALSCRVLKSKYNLR